MTPPTELASRPIIAHARPASFLGPVCYLHMPGEPVVSVLLEVSRLIASATLATVNSEAQLSSLIHQCITIQPRNSTTVL